MIEYIKTYLIPLAKSTPRVKAVTLELCNLSSTNFKDMAFFGDKHYMMSPFFAFHEVFKDNKFSYFF